MLRKLPADECAHGESDESTGQKKQFHVTITPPSSQWVRRVIVAESPDSAAGTLRVVGADISEGLGATQDASGGGSRGPCACATPRLSRRAIVMLAMMFIGRRCESTAAT